MGLFNSYLKPGKGVSKDEPEKKGFFLYWEIAFRKFSKILGANAVYTLASLIWIVLLVMFFGPYVSSIGGLLEKAQGAEADAGNIQLAVLHINVMLASATFFILGSGPASASYAYIVKCFTNHQHAWIMSDGWDKFKENFKQSMIIVLFDVVYLLLASVALRFYYMKIGDGGTIFGIPFYLMIVLTFVVGWMHFYIYQIMVTFECTVKQLMKNALLFALGKLPMNLLLTILSVGVTGVIFMYIGNPIAAFILTMLIGMFFTRFASEFYAARCMRGLVAAAKKKEREEKGNILEEEAPVFDDSIADKLKKGSSSEVNK